MKTRKVYIPTAVWHSDKPDRHTRGGGGGYASIAFAIRMGAKNLRIQGTSGSGKLEVVQIVADWPQQYWNK